MSQPSCLSWLMKRVSRSLVRLTCAGPSERWGRRCGCQGLRFRIGGSSPKYIAGDPLSLGEEEQSDEGGEGAIARVDLSEMKERFHYCTEALVRGATLPSEQEVRKLLREWGDSLVVIRTGNALKLHIHINEPNRVFELLGYMGRLITRKAEDLAAQRKALERAAAEGNQLVHRPLGVVTDSACDLPEEVVRAHGIRIVPLELIAENRTYRDRVDISAEEFARSMESDEAHFTTSHHPLEPFWRAFATLRRTRRSSWSSPWAPGSREPSIQPRRPPVCSKIHPSI